MYPQFLEFVNRIYSEHYGFEFDWAKAKFTFDTDLKDRLNTSTFVEPEIYGHTDLRFIKGSEYDTLDEQLDGLLDKLSNIGMRRPTKGRNILLLCTAILDEVTDIKLKLTKIFGFQRILSPEDAKSIRLGSITFPDIRITRSIPLHAVKFSVYDLNILVNAVPTVGFAEGYLSDLHYGPVFLGYFLYQCGLGPKLEEIDKKLMTYCNTQFNRNELSEMLNNSHHAIALMKKLPNTYGYIYPE